METWKFKVKNVKCGGCVSSVTDALKDLKGVEKVEVDLNGEVELKGEGFDKAQAKSSLKEIGYPLKGGLFG